MGMRVFWLLMGLAMCLPAQAEIVYQTTSQYQDIYVRQDGSRRCMQFNRTEGSVRFYQGCYYTGSNKLVFGYSEALLATLLISPNPKRILVIGLGVGVTPMALRHTVPNALVEVVELDPEVVRVAEQYFGWPKDDSHLKTYVADGRQFIRGAAEQGIKYDIVILDAFTGDYVPEHMMTLDFLEEVKLVLNDGAAIGANTFAVSQLYDHESVTYEAAFGPFRNVEMEGKASNRVVIAGYPMPHVEPIRMNAHLYAQPFWSNFELNVNDLLTNMEDARDWDTTARVLTDQYSPANVLAGRPRIKDTWSSTIAGALTRMSDENPTALAVGLIAIVMGILFGTVRFFDFLVRLRRRGEATE